MTILFDIDETLINRNGYPKNFYNIKNLISFLKMRGVNFGICTNRPYDDNINKIIKNYSLNGPIIVESGCRVVAENDNFKDNGLNDLLLSLINNYLLVKKINYEVIIGSSFDVKNKIIINEFRTETATIRLPLDLILDLDEFIDFLSKSDRIKNMEIKYYIDEVIKINIYPKDINKISAINKLFPKEEVIFVTDFERVLSKSKKNILLYSVGNDSYFNSMCDKTYSEFGDGVEEILNEVREKYERI